MVVHRVVGHVDHDVAQGGAGGQRGPDTGHALGRAVDDTIEIDEEEHRTMLPSAHAPGPPHHALRRHRSPHHRRDQPALPPRDGDWRGRPGLGDRRADPRGGAPRDHHRPRVRRRRPRRLRAPGPEDGRPLLGSQGRRRHDPGPGLRGHDARRRPRGGGPGARGDQRPRAARPPRGEGRPHRAPPVVHRQAQRPGPGHDGHRDHAGRGSARAGPPARVPTAGTPRATRIARAGSPAAARPPSPGRRTRSPATSATRARRADRLRPRAGSRSSSAASSGPRPRTCAGVTPPVSICA